MLAATDARWLKPPAPYQPTPTVGRTRPPVRTAARANRGLRLRAVFFAVRLQRGGPWDWTRGLREQDGWEEHASFMDSLVNEGFLVLGGPLEGDREILHVIDAPSEEAVRRRLAEDNWARNGMLAVASVEAWTVLLDGRSR
jgi:uncharacterized protein YciI